MTPWYDLLVYDASDELPNTLGSVLLDYRSGRDDRLDDATIGDLRICEWPNVFLAAPGESPDWNTPLAPVAWDGFYSSLLDAQQTRQRERGNR